jgi:predicted ester cyclase
MTYDLADRARRLVEVGIGRADRSVLDELMADNCVEHQRGNGDGREGAWAVAGTLHRWMSDFSLTVEDLAVAGDTVWTRNRARGINTGAVMGNPPSGKPIEVDVIDVIRFENGIAVEHWGVADQMGLMLQIGALPSSRPQPAQAR